MKKLRKICLIPLYGPIIYFFIVDNKLKKKGLVSNKITFAYLFIMSFLGVLAMIFSMLICIILNIEFGYDIISFIISALLIWIFIMIPVINFSKKLD